VNAYQRKKAEDRENGPPERPLSWNVCKAVFGPTKYEKPMRVLLGEEGPLARALPNYQPREMQITLAEAIYRGLCEGKHVIAEAGCGAGKSFSALIPAIHWVMEQGGAKANHRILVSTAMIILQDQYTKKDLPFLEENLGYDFEWCKRKGRSNYACEVRLDRANPDKLPRDQRPFFDEVANWVSNTHEGDLAELPFDINQRPELKKAVTIKGTSCKGRKCELFENCFYYNSKDRAVNCEIVVVNHALLVLNELYNGMILPEYDAVIIDEAHKLESIVRDNLAEELSLRAFNGLLDSAEELDLFSGEKLAELRTRGELNLDSIENTLLRLVKFPGKQRFAKGTLPDTFADWLTELKDIVAQVWLSARRAAENEDGDSDSSQAKDLVISSETLGKAIGAFISQDPSFVIWGDRRTGKDDVDRVTLCQAPIKVASWMQAHLLGKPCIFLSATLATGRGESAFVPFKEAMGIGGGAIELQVDSPFDFARNARYSLGYYPAGPAKPPSAPEEWAAIITPRIKLVLELTKGGALVLFTSRKVMNDVHWSLACANTKAGNPWLLLKQDDASKDQLVEMFKTGMNSVLCATASFFEGVDIPGSALRCVIIDKIPFPMPSDPVQEAISESYGKEGFHKHSIPHAITHLKQGVGRLIRSESDKGLLVLLDPRMRSAGYAKKILSALPGYSYAAQADEIEEFMATIDLSSSNGEPETPRAELVDPLPTADDLGIFEGCFDV
jgi:ATP-dependent DNA helicase DinG